MTEDRARQVANAVMVAAALAATYVVVRTPALRRVAWRLAVTTLTATIPAWLTQEVRQAWAESARDRL